MDWDQLGIHLKVPDDVRTKIDRENHTEARKLSKLLSHWLRNDKSPSWEKIVKALERIGDHGNIITSIKSQYMCTHNVKAPPPLPPPEVCF